MYYSRFKKFSEMRLCLWLQRTTRVHIRADVRRFENLTFYPKRKSLKNTFYGEMFCLELWKLLVQHLPLLEIFTQQNLILETYIFFTTKIYRYIFTSATKSFSCVLNHFSQQCSSVTLSNINSMMQSSSQHTAVTHEKC